MSSKPWKWLLAYSSVLAFLGLATAPLGAAELGSGTLAVAGTQLEIKPHAQTVPFNTPTIVQTKLAGFVAADGPLPPDLRVLADFTGPEIDGVLVLETIPNEPFRIPRLSVKGQYQLDNIRLVQGDDLLAYAQPRSAGVLVTQVLVTRVTSRPLTLDEIRSYGVVVGDENFQAFNFTFGFAVGSETFDYNLPVLYSPVGGGRLQVLTDMAQAGPGGSTGTTAPRFQPPQMAPFNLKLEPRPEGEPVPLGGCGDAEGDCFIDAPVTLPGVILFPTDISLLHQFFSVVLLAKNDAPEGDALRIRDLAARVVLPSGLRMAQTEPPTPLGVPVPVRVPGADGKLGTGDDLTFLVAQAEGQAEVLVEGVQQGTHIVEFQLDGTLDGLPGDEVRRISGTARGAVVVRDPTLSMTITHPDVVRTDEPYSLLLTISNTSASPVNLLSVSLPATGLSGVELAAGETNQKTIATLLPGDAEVVEFKLKSRRTGRVVASSVRSASSIDPRFELVMGVGEEGIPLSPTALVLPRSTDVLPKDMVRRGLSLLGLGWSLATAPPSLKSDLPRPGLEQIHEKVYWLGQAGRHVSLGEAPFDSLSVLALEWAGVRDKDWDWDDLRRRTQKGGLWGDELGRAFHAGEPNPENAFRRFAATTAFLGPLHGALAVGSDATLEVSSRTSGKTISGVGTDPARRRELPFADFYRLGNATASVGQMVAVAVAEENGFRARLRIAGGGTAGLQLLVPGPNKSLRKVSWSAVSLTANGVATVDFKASFVDSEIVLQIDADGDGVPEDSDLGTVTAITPRAFQALAAVQNPVDPSGHMIEVLFTQDVDLRSLLPNDPNRFQIPGKVSNGGLVPIEEDIANFFEVLHKNPFEGLRDTRIVRVVFDNPVSPLIANQKIAISALKSVSGQLLDDEEVPLTFPPGFDQGVEVRGTVYGSDGLPVPFARVELFETDFFYHFPTPCRQHRTAAVQADASGRFHFDYVRQTSCGDVFSVAGTDPGSGRHGSSRARVRFTGSTMQVDIVMLGRGTIRGKVRYEDGTIPPALDVIAYSPVFFEGKEARLGPDGTYQVGDVPVGTVTLGANDREGGYVFQTVEVPAAGAVVERDLTIIRRPSTRAVGEVRGVVLETDGVTPVYNAYLALYVDGELVGVQRSDPDGLFDFGIVLAGRAQLEGFDGETGLSGVQVEFDVKPDQVNQVTLRLKNDRGTVQGHVYVQTLSTATPLAGVVVWVSGTPFNTVTDANGYYRLEGVFAGDRSVLAADLANNRQTSAQVSLTGNGGTVTRDLYFVESVGSGLVGEVIGFNGNPVPGALVHLSTGGDQWFGEAVTDAAGRFSFPNLQVGTYAVHAIKAKDGGRQTATIRFQGETPFVRVQFKKGTIRGTVTIDNASGPVAVVALVTYRTTVVRGGMVGLDWETHTLETKADGTFELPNVLLGSYVLTVSNALHGEKTVRGELVYAGEIAEHEIEFEPNGTIRGVVLNWDGTPPEIVDNHGPEVVLRHPNFLADVETDAAGRFRFDLVPPGGRFPIEVSWQDGAISRQAQIWVTFTEFGQELDVEIRLPRQGAVSGYVEDANGNPIPGAVVTLQEHAFPQRLLIQNADGEGHFSYTNIFAGVVSLSAKAPSLGGLGAKKTVTIATEGEEVDALLVLEATGEIVGKVLSPEGAGAPVAVPTAQVTLYRGNGLFDTVTSDEAGAFRFRLLPLGSYTVWVFDPRVGRHGRSAVLTLQQNNQVLEQNVTLEGRGNVLGHLYEPSSTVGIPGATIRLETQSLAPFTTFSSTDVAGAFTFEGIPEGEFRLSTREPEGRRRAWGEGEITREDEDVTVNLYLEASGRVLGSVLKPTGVPTGLFPNANTLIYQDGQVVGATLENPFSFAGVIADREFELRSYEVGGGHQAAQRGLLTLADEDGEVTVDLRMVPLGSAAITVNDSFGNPVPGAGVTVQNNGFYGAKLFQGSTAANGRVVFEGAGEGNLSVYATHPVSGLRGSGNGTITAEGQVAEIAVKLEDSGRVRGRAVLPDGVTPAVKAMVVVTASGRRLQSLTDTDGAFSFASVPLGPVALLVQGVIQDGKGTGEINRGGTLASNGQEIDFGLLILDDAPPYVKTLSPAPGTRDLPLSTAVAIDFSEVIDSARFQSNWVSFQTLSGNGVGYTVAWQDGGKKMVLTPSAPLTSFTGYEVVVHTAFDLAGRALSDRVKTVFHTVDIVPPNVIDVLPRDGQSQVPLNTLIKVTFTEPVATASLSGNALQLTDLTTGQGITTTFLHLAGHREVILTPVEALQNNHRYQLRVQSVQDKSGNVMAQAVTTTFWSPDTIPPQIQSVTPAEGTTYTAGDRIPVTVAATDERGLGAATVAYAGWTFTDAVAPYAWSVPAPVVSQPSDVTLTVKVKDIFGNESTATRTIRVEPRINANAPQVAIACAADGDAVVPEVQAEFIMTASDDEGIESYRFLVDGQVVQATSPVDLPAAETSFFWAPPKGAVAGSYLVRIEARDFAGNVGFRELTVSIPNGTILTGSKSLTSTYANQALVLANGTFTIRDPLSFSSVILVRGATLVTPDDDPDMAFTVTGALKMQCGSTVRPGAWGDVLLTLGSANVAPGALIDVSGRGFAGGDGGHPDGYAPAGVAGASGMNAAGSHGGHGGPAGEGEVYGSITEPRLGGGGGATGSFAFNTSPGGGALELAVTGDLVLGGELRAQGKDGCSGGAGAGGSVLVHAGTVRGGGLIDASGGSHEPGCSWSPGAGGGGRVAVHGNLDGFDPAAQARVWGGGVRNNAGFAAPGTVYFKTPQQTWGVLVIDRGTWNGADREGAPTELPALQSGEYRFDRIELRNGAAVASDTPVVTTDLSLTGEVTLEGPVSTQNMTLEETAVLRPVGGGEMLLSVPGRLTVAAGARIDVSDRGYAGGVNGAPDGGAPLGVPGANGTWAAGSHGGRGIGTAPVFDSVYDPRLGGGGGAKGYEPYQGGVPGGGVLRIVAGEVVLDGELRSKGGEVCAAGGGAGGTVSIRTPTLGGSGLIDVSGSDEKTDCFYNAGAAGGGRVSLVVGAFSGFNPATQVRAWGGKRKNSAPPYAAAGTVYYKLPEHQWGVLQIDSGAVNGVDRAGGLLTDLPVLGSGAVTAFAAIDVPAPAEDDAWVSRAGGFSEAWRGAWMELLGGSGSLGLFQVTDLDPAQGRVRLAGAGSLSGVASYAGVYRFDRMDLLHGASYDADDPIVGPELVIEGNAAISGEIRASNVRIKAGALVTPATGGELRLIVDGTLTVEPGAVLDVSGRGYAGGDTQNANGRAPAGVAGASGLRAGGAHGGRGIHGSSQVFDSVYEPRLGGGGGAKGTDAIHTGKAGGGVLSIEAGTVVLDGELRSRAEEACANGGGAGGTVQVRTGTLRGSGQIDVSGSDDLANCFYEAGAGGGGRVSLLVGTFDGFDPAAQVRAWGGKRKLQPEIPYASPGTIYYRRTADTYGVLRIDNGEESGVDRKSMPTQLPALGGGAVTELLPAGGGDFWIDRGSAFPTEWHGAWVTLSNSASPDLGSFRVAEIGADGRALLAGVSPEAAGAATNYRGEYRFDRLEVANGSDLQATDRIVATDTTLEGDLQLAADLRGQNLLIKAGAKVVPVTGSGGELQFIATGTMTVETGAVIDVSNLGYPEGGAPPGVAPASGWANGGNHGGAGGIGEFYDSVYEPWLPGAGGTAGGAAHGWPGGGVVRITASQVVLEGTIRARGKDACGGAGGAGGTVLVRTTGTLSGTGQIDVSGGTAQWAGCGYAGNSGGGGRAALHVGSFSGFDPATQVNVQGGVLGVAGAGTLLTRTSTQTYGALRVDQRATSGDYFVTVLPSVGRGTVGSIWPATNPADLWIQSQDANVKFSLGVAGIWARVGGIEYPILELSADRKRLLLQGAAGKVTVGQRYLGIYKFDSVTVAGRAKLEFKDGDVIGTTSVASGSTLTRIESTPPAVSFTQPAAGTLYASGQSITVAVTATDASGIASVTFRLGAQSFTDTAAPYEWTVPAPVVEAEGDHTIEVTAMDVPANEAVVTRTIRIRPPVLGAPPVVALSCPTPGALLAPGTGLDFHVAASSDDGVERVDLFVGTETTAAATDLSAPYVLRFTAPAGVLDGAVLQVKLRARTYTGATAEVTYPVTVVAGSVIVADTTLAAANASLDNQSVVVAGGTLTIQGVHNFRDLVVLDGARVTHSETTASQVHTLEVGVQRDLYVACGGSVDVTGRGYLGAVNGQRAYGYANSQTEGALSQVGGSHGGRGGRFDGSSPVYGNVFDPQAPGAGGGHDGSTKGRDGGGVIRVTALGDVVIDGAVLADGETGSSGGGAGGSIRIHTETLTGAGRIQANGSAGGNANVGGGSGGRVALYAVTMDAGLVGRTTTAGAKTSSTDASRWGAAGTLFIQRDTDELGQLIVDNEGTASTQLTDLPAVRSGIVDAVGETGFTDNEADFRHGVAGVEVAFNDDPTLYMVVGHAHHGQTLTLDVPPVPPLSTVVEPGDSYRGVYRFDAVTVRGGARVISVDQVQSTVAPAVESGAEWTESYAPTLQIVSPAAGTVFASGDTVAVNATVQDVLGVRDVVFRLGEGLTSTDTASPWAWSLTAPTVTQPTDLELSATATDHAGNRIAQSLTVRVEPLVDPVPPVVTLTGCVASGDAVVPGAAVALPFLITDDRKIQSYSFEVDGQVVQTTAVGAASAGATWTWTPPANAAAGQVFALRIAAVDYGGTVGSATLALKVPSTPMRTGTQTLTSALDGTAVFLGSGTFTIQGTFAPASLTLLSGAKVVNVVAEAAKIATAGEVRVQCGASIDVSGQGYAGGVSGSPNGGAPAGVTGSAPDAGGSHGGFGSPWNPAAGPAGALYDSVYLPHLAGGGGAQDNDGSGDGQRGGGVLEIEAGTLVLQGDLRARGGDSDDVGRPAGAGGSVRLTAGTLAGSGRIDASGGFVRSCVLSREVGTGGGGRVALDVDQLSGFDPVTQVRAQGGTFYSCSSIPLRYAGPGTVLVKEGAAVHGRLIVDNGEEANGTDRRDAPVTSLPGLGSGTVDGFVPEGGDAWITAASAFPSHWLGARMALFNAAGNRLGDFLVTALNGVQARLAGAAGADTATNWRGEYWFDRIDLLHGVGLIATDPLTATGTVEVDGAVRLDGDVQASTMTVRTGAVLSPALSGRIRLGVTNQLTVQTGARIDVTGQGYAGGIPGSADGTAPAGVAGSKSEAGGSHGGFGSPWNLALGPAGALYDSVYEPHLAGGGGALDSDGSGNGNPGGGIVEIVTSQLSLQGEIRARGLDSDDSGQAAGAGGTVWIDAGLLSGAGSIDASGGFVRSCVTSREVGAGGGGRVALAVDQFSGFDPVTRVKAWGGAFQGCSGNPLRYAGPGTVLVKDATAIHGRLIVDNGEEANGTDRTDAPTTELPLLGFGDVTAHAPVGAGPDAWVTAATAFPAQWLGARMALFNAAGDRLGDYRVIALAGNQARLAGASGATAAARWQGEYWFDRVDLLHGVRLIVHDRQVYGHLETDGAVRVNGTIEAQSVTLRTGSVVSLSQGERLRLEVNGLLDIPANARLDVSGSGYAGGRAGFPVGVAPLNVTGSGPDAGGSHSGIGSPWNPASGPAGVSYGSVYEPHLSGAGGGQDDDWNGDGRPGGGILEIVADHLDLDGEIRARGQDNDDIGGPAGAGGSIWIDADQISGSGLIDASGGFSRACVVSREGGTGGGGRVALYADLLTGFDPLTQVRTRGGIFYGCSWSRLRQAGPGTVFVKTPSQTWGRLIVDQGGTNGQLVTDTQVAAIGIGTIGSTSTDANHPGALWIEPSNVQTKFSLGVAGMWVRIGTTDYRVIGQSADLRKLLLAGADGAVGTGVSYRGVYKFDDAYVRGGARLVLRDTNEVGTWNVDATSSVVQNVP